jgi:hypothetical protein
MAAGRRPGLGRAGVADMIGTGTDLIAGYLAEQTASSATSRQVTDGSG